MATAATDIAKGLRPALLSGAMWTAEDYRTVLRTVASSTLGAVPVSKLESSLGAGGDAKLNSLLKHNYLVRRSHDLLASDIPAVAYAVDGAMEDVMTLPSTAHLAAARRQFKVGTNGQLE